MLDVHPPHESAHSWRDFFIHIATIVVGLLIAIGLEQTVEAIHHRVQRHELVENLTVEAGANSQDGDQTLDGLAAYLRWSQASYRQMLFAPAAAPLILPPFPEVHVLAPQGQEWRDALSSGEVNVLPPLFRAHYAEAYYFFDKVTQFESQASSNFYTLDTLLGPVPRTKDGGFDLTTLNSEQRKPILQAIATFRSDSLGLMRQTMFLEIFSSANQHAVASDNDAWNRAREAKADALTSLYPELATHLSDKPGKP